LNHYKIDLKRHAHTLSKEEARDTLSKEEGRGGEAGRRGGGEEDGAWGLDRGAVDPVSGQTLLERKGV
jgi:hypothetical protein